MKKLGKRKERSFYFINHYLLAAAFVQIIWGLAPSASHTVINEIPVELYITLRWSISGLVFLILNFLFQSGKHKINTQTFFQISILGILGYGFASVGTLYGLKIGGPINFSLFSASGPIVVSLMSILFLKERPKVQFFIALILTILGMSLLVFGKHKIATASIALASAAFIVGGYILEALIFVFSKKLKKKSGLIQYMTIAQCSAALFYILLQIFYYKQMDKISSLSISGWVSLIFVSLVACVFCYFALYWLLRRIDGHKLSLFEGLHTISASLFAYLFFKEQFHNLMIMGSILILVALYLGNKKTSPKK